MIVSCGPQSQGRLLVAVTRKRYDTRLPMAVRRENSQGRLCQWSSSSPVLDKDGCLRLSARKFSHKDDCLVIVN